MSDEEYNKIVAELKKKYLGKKVITIEGEEAEVLDIHIDHRKEHQSMNRIETEYGVYFLEDIGNFIFIKEEQ